MESALEAIGDDASFSGYHCVRRKYAGLLFDAGREAEALEIFDDVVKRTESRALTGCHIEALFNRTEYEERSNLRNVAEESYFRVLNYVRESGLKAEELRVYRAYARWLRKRSRYEEALVILEKALLLEETFQRFRQIPSLLIEMARIQMALGNSEEVEALHTRIESHLKSHPDMDTQRLLAIQIFRMDYLKFRGRWEDVETVYRETESIVSDSGLNDFQKRSFTTYSPDAALEFPESGVVSDASVSKRLGTDSISADLQPMEMVTVVAEGEDARGRFTVSNPASGRSTGNLTVHGAHLEENWDEEAGIWYVRLDADAAAAAGEVRRSIALHSQEQIVVFLESSKPPAEGSSEARLLWDGKTQQKAVWTYSVSAHDAVVAVVNASSVRNNPFYSVPIYHEIYYRGEGSSVIDFRVLTPGGLRVEVVDDETRQIIATDATGNGSFRDSGDVVFLDANQNGFPDFALSDDRDVAAIELHVYPADMDSEFIGNVHIQIQLRDEATAVWRTHAEDVLELGDGRR